MENKTKFNPYFFYRRRQGKFTKFVLLTFRKKFKNETFKNLKFLKHNYSVHKQYEIVSCVIGTSNYAKCLLLGISKRKGKKLSGKLICSGKFKAIYGRCPITGHWVQMIESLFDKNFQL